MKLLTYLKDKIPFELKRGTSFISIVLALIIAGLFTRLGEIVLEKALDFIKPYIPTAVNGFKFIWDFIILLMSVSFEVNVFGLIIFVILLFPIYRMIDKFFLKKMRGEIVFKDEFNAGNKGWQMNYWGSNNPQKTNRIENSYMVFEATESDLTNSKKEFGAYIDLKNGIYQGNEYEVICRVAADANTTMQFRLWLHDTRGSSSSIQTNYITPTEKISTLSLKFTSNKTNAIRIHLHNKAGLGKIKVKEVIVKKI